MRPRDLEKEQAIRAIALDIIANEGLENLSMQKLAKAANVSPRTIYIKYENKEDFLIKLFINEVLGTYEQAVLDGFDENMDFEEGLKKLWLNAFGYLTRNRPSFALIRYGQSSPLLNRAFQQENIKQGHFFAPIHQFLMLKAKEGLIKSFPHDVYTALLFSPLLSLASEFFDYEERVEQIITKEVVMQCCEVLIKGLKD